VRSRDTDEVVRVCLPGRSTNDQMGHRGRRGGGRHDHTSRCGRIAPILAISDRMGIPQKLPFENEYFTMDGPMDTLR
jgi:hypothetical protein